MIYDICIYIYIYINMYIYTQILNIHTIICRLPIGGSRGAISWFINQREKYQGRHQEKNTVWLLENKRTVHPYSLHWTKKRKTLQKNKPKNLCFGHFFAAEISYLYNIRRVLEPKHAICMVFQAFWPWIFEIYLQLKSLVCRICAGFWNLNMQFALYLKRFGLESLVCTVLAASWSQHLYYAGDYLQYFVVFATCCLELVWRCFKIYFRLV